MSDSEILDRVTKALKTVQHLNIPVRQWYWALIDYGVFLKAHYKNPSRRSAHHVVQSKFEGSVRQPRGALLRALTGGGQDVADLRVHCADPDKLKKVLQRLVSEELIYQKGGRYYLGDGILSE